MVNIHMYILNEIKIFTCFTVQECGIKMVIVIYKHEEFFTCVFIIHLLFLPFILGIDICCDTIPCETHQ